MEKRFARNIEDFTCENCGMAVKGNGYTNHCPSCLYSKHVDINPGDRKAKCGGIMEPISIENGRKGYIIIFKCKKCGEIKKNRTNNQDNMNVIIKISANPS